MVRLGDFSDFSEDAEDALPEFSTCIPCALPESALQWLVCEISMIRMLRDLRNVRQATHIRSNITSIIEDASYLLHLPFCAEAAVFNDIVGVSLPTGSAEVGEGPGTMDGTKAGALTLGTNAGAFAFNEAAPSAEDSEIAGSPACECSFESISQLSGGASCVFDMSERITPVIW